MRHLMQLANIGLGLWMALALACGGSGGGSNPIGPSTSFAPSFNFGPLGQSVASGETVTFIAAATGAPNPTIQWERSNDNGANWSAINAAVGNTYAFTAQTNDNGSWFRATATNSAGIARSTPAKLSVMVPDFWVDHATFTQGILKEGVPLIAGKAGVLQVYVVADISTSIKPPVTVDVYQGGTKVRTLKAILPEKNTPTTPTEAWNVQFAGEDCQPGNTFIINVDPDNTLSETNKNNNIFPIGGSLSYTFNVLKNFDLTMVPILLSYGTTGITPSNIHTYTELTRNVLPIGPMTEVVHSPFTPSISEAGSGADWSLIAQELRVIHLVEKPEGDYFGILHANPDPSKNPYGGAYFGIRTILSLDPSAWSEPRYGNQLVAHEIGHSFLLRHTPCGTGDVIDNPYPYPDGIINNPGIDPETLLTYTANAKDLMGYCSTPEGVWISDYNYNIAYNYRASDASSPIVLHQEKKSFLVWGRQSDGKWLLEPSFNLAQVPSPPQPGNMRIEGMVGNRVIFSTSFAVQEERGEKTFAFTIPGHYDLDSICLYEGNTQVSCIRKTLGSPDRLLPSLLRSEKSNLARLKWNNEASPLAMVTNEKGEVVALVRNNHAVGFSDTFQPSGKAYTVHLSNGTGSTAHKIVLIE